MVGVMFEIDDVIVLIEDSGIEIKVFGCDGWQIVVQDGVVWLIEDEFRLLDVILLFKVVLIFLMDFDFDQYCVCYGFYVLIQVGFVSLLELLVSSLLYFGIMLSMFFLQIDIDSKFVVQI